MLQLSVENHSSKTATCGLDSIFKVIVKFKYSYQEFNLISQPLKGNGNEGWGDGKWNTGLSHAGKLSDSLPDMFCWLHWWWSGTSAGHQAPLSHCPRAQGLGKSPRHPYWDCWSWGLSTPLPTTSTGQQLVKINLAVFSFFWESQSWNNVQTEPTTQAKTASLLGSDWRFSPPGTPPSPFPGLCSSPSGPLEAKCPHPSCQCLPQILHR